MSYPLVRDLAADGIPVAVTCRVLGFSRQAFYAWNTHPVSPRELADAFLTDAALAVHADDPEFGYRFVADAGLADTSGLPVVSVLARRSPRGLPWRRRGCSRSRRPTPRR